LQRISGIIYYGGALYVKALGKELFSKKFKKTFNWKRLTNKKTVQIKNKLAAKAKWYNGFNADCI
jgi:hypothetical protein